MVRSRPRKVKKEPNSREAIRRHIAFMIEAEAEAQGSGWVHPEEVGAHVETRPGSDMWQIPSDAYLAALERVFARLVEKYEGKKKTLSAAYGRAVENFEVYLSEESLVELAIVLAQEGVRF